MELRILKYFLMVAREENITRAANLLHVTQPTLSRQLMQLEDELGVKLFYRTNHRITLTDEGLLLKRRAQELLELAERTEREVSRTEGSLMGEIAIGCGEARNLTVLADAMAAFRRKYPLVQYMIYSGIADDLKERLESGLLDIGFLTEPVDVSKYGFVRMPEREVWGLLVRSDSPLAQKSAVQPQDLLGEPLLIPKRDLVKNELANWFGRYYDRMDFAATYTLFLNAAIMARSGVGSVLCLNMGKIYSDLVFVPLSPTLKTGTVLVWKKNQRMAPALEEFVKELRSYVTGIAGDKI
ncbi:MAG: LysR family transcriptional regulator [Phascolarctobacterium sp.]|nr:MAG: LysR family transcriptional regulator [Phascolarctobacterium sp.]